MGVIKSGTVEECRADCGGGTALLVIIPPYEDHQAG